MNYQKMWLKLKEYLESEANSTQNSLKEVLNNFKEFESVLNSLDNVDRVGVSEVLKEYKSVSNNLEEFQRVLNSVRLFSMNDIVKMMEDIENEQFTILLGSN
ncbi:hypothetical protein ACIQ1D_19135 [Lysinibacillus xylanilyticus]|uniref:hypothetical protein n=1 Tax=Lysinibacillus xylanilyticus TaxID=582475 RepID=UPI0038209555